MRWSRRRSQNVEDRRGQAGYRMGAASGGGILSLLLRVLPMLLRSKMGRRLLGVVMVVGVGAHFLGFNVLGLLAGNGQQVLRTTTEHGATYQGTPEEEKLAEFVKMVLAETEQTWHVLFQKMGKEYPEPKLVLFTGSVKSACGFARAAMGPFYCGLDNKVYIDLSFYEDLKRRHGAPGDFAQAYVIAHEVGHHIQNVLGISKKVRTMKSQVNKTQANQLSVRQELQADCFAGVWAYYADKTQGLVEAGDIQEALTAAAAIGDDRLQKQARGYVTPDSFTHGSSEQRVRWFKKGFAKGLVNECDTFSVQTL